MGIGMSSNMPMSMAVNGMNLRALHLLQMGTWMFNCEARMLSPGEEVDAKVQSCCCQLPDYPSISVEAFLQYR
jgi:hypothetical protein